MSRNKSLFLLTILYVAAIVILKRFELPTEQIVLPEYMDTNKLPFIVVISLLFIVLILILFKKKLNIWTVLEMGGILLLLIPLNLIFISKKDYQKIDFLMSSKVSNFQERSFPDGRLKITEIITESDTIYKNQNPNWVKIYDGKYNLYQSTFHNYLYLTKSTDK